MKRSGGFARGIFDLLEAIMTSEIKATTPSDTVVMIGIDIVVISKDGDSDIGFKEGLGFVIFGTEILIRTLMRALPR